MNVTLQHIGRALPERRYGQLELLEHSPWGRNPTLDRLFLDSAVASRGLAIPPAWWKWPRTLQETNRAWLQAALDLGEAALRDATDPASIDALFVTTVTGVATPGLDLLLAKRLGLRSDLARVHFNQIGCHAAIPLLRVASDHVRRRPQDRAVALAVEVCSACFVPDEATENLVALSLFGDGAAAVALAADGEGPALLDFASAFDFETMDWLGFDLSANGFRIRLDPRVPDVIERTLAPAVDALLARNGLARSDVAGWAIHPGGKRILDAAQSALRLDDDAMRPSRRILREVGNMSSPSILFALSEVLDHGPVGPVVAAAFGPGVGVELALLDVPQARD